MYINQIRRQAFYDLRALGYSPIPMRRGGVRKPCIIGWTQYCERQATDQEIEYWVRTFPDCNIAVCGGYNGLVPLDIDDPVMVGDLAAILPTDTTGRFGSKGLAPFYRSSDTKARAFTVGGKAAVEFIGAGRNILVPPSVHEATGNLYRWVTPLRPVAELPELPADAARRCYAALVSRYGAEACGGDPDRAATAPASATGQAERSGFVGGLMRAWALGGLKREAERVAETPEGGRNRQLYNSAAALGKYVHHGVLSEGELTDVMMEACASNGYVYDLLRGGGPDAVRTTIQSGLDASVNDTLPDIGQTSVIEAFGAEPPPVPPGGSLTPFSATAAVQSATVLPFPQQQATPTRRAKVILPTDVPLRPKPGLIHRLYPLGNPGDFSYLFGYYGSKKSWYALYRAICIAAGIEFFGYKTQQRFTAYYAAENPKSIHVRAHCICKHLGLDLNTLPFVIISGLGDLKEQANRMELTSTILEFTKNWGPCGLLEIDTVTEAFHFEHENEPQEWLAVQHACREMGMAIGGAVDCIHHIGKDASKGGRGSSAIGGSHDFSITLEKQDDGTTRAGYGAGDKMRDVNDREYPRIAFQIEPYVLDGEQDVFGDPWSSGYPIQCAIEALSQTTRSTADQALHDAFMASGPIFPVDIPNMGKRQGRPHDAVRKGFMLFYKGKGDANYDAKKRAWCTLIKIVEAGEHDEYFMTDQKIIVTKNIDAAEAFNG